MRKNIFTFLGVLFICSTVFGQWTFDGVFPADSSLKANTGVHGITVTPDGNVWVAPYRPFVTDSVFIPDSNKKYNCRYILRFNPEGTTCDTIRYVYVDGILRVLRWSKTGLTQDHEGNIIVVDFNELIKINYQTLEGMAYANLASYFTQGSSQRSICDPGVVENGEMYVVSVFPGLPIVHLDTNFTYLDNAIDAFNKDYGRCFEARSDGDSTWLYAARYNGLWIYKKVGDFGTFELVDSLIGPHPETIEFDPVDGHVWLSSGNTDSPPTGGLTVGAWYKFDLSTKTAIDSMFWNWQTGVPNSAEKPRGFGISNDGNTAWAGCFGSSSYPPVQKFSKPVGIQQDENVIPTGYNLSQNYPNPFNPSTQITFAIPEAGMVTVKVYNILGQEVATLVNEQMNAGQFTTTFNAANLASGTYIYELRVNNVRLTNKMLLLK